MEIILAVFIAISIITGGALTVLFLSTLYQRPGITKSQRDIY